MRSSRQTSWAQSGGATNFLDGEHIASHSDLLCNRLCGAVVYRGNTYYACRGEVPKTVRNYVGGLGGYKKNNFSTLEPKLKQRIADEWADSFNEFGYKF